MGGGLCVVRGASLRALARALVELGSETIYMAPEARELVEALRVAGAPGAARPAS